MVEELAYFLVEKRKTIVGIWVTLLNGYAIGFSRTKMQIQELKFYILPNSEFKFENSEFEN